MDSIYMMNIQNQRMLENTQRSSDGMRTNMMRERKDKASVRKGRYVDDTMEFSSEMSDGGGDLLGGMDDLVGGGGGGGGAALFRKMWEEDVEEEDKKAAERSAETLFDEGQGTSLINTAETSEAENAPLGELVAPGENEEAEGEESQEPEEPVVEEKTTVEQAPKSDSLGPDAIVGSDKEIVEEKEPKSADEEPESADEIRVKAQEALEEARKKMREAEEEAQRQKEAAEAEERERAERAKRTVKIPTGEESQAAPALEDVDLSASRVKEKGGGGSSFVASYLDNSEGFIFHEAVQEIIEVSGAAVVEKTAEQLKVPQELEGVLDALIVSDDKKEAEGLRLLLSRFGKGVLDTCVRTGVRVKLVAQASINEAVVRAEPALRGQVIGQGAYLPGERLCLLAADLFSLGGPPLRGFHPALFYFAMAWDHAMGEESFSSLKSPAIKANAQACHIGLEGHLAPDAMASSDPVNYFAQTVEAYFSACDCVEPLWEHDDLYDFDRLMYDYLEYLLHKNNK